MINIKGGKFIRHDTKMQKLGAKSREMIDGAGLIISKNGLTMLKTELPASR